MVQSGILSELQLANSGGFEDAVIGEPDCTGIWELANKLWIWYLQRKKLKVATPGGSQR